MSNKAVRANLTYAKIRVGVAITSTNNAVNTASFSKLKAIVQHVVPAAALEYVYIVLGAELDPIGRNKFIKELQFAADTSVLGVGKRLYEVQGTTDSKVWVFGKRLTESKVTTESKSFAISKRLADSVHPTDDFQGLANADDDQVMVFTKTLTVESKHATDIRTSSLSKPRSDSVGKSDVQTSAFGKSLTDTSETSDAHTYTFSKLLEDSVDAGDEFNAVALTDDGEVMVFGKTLGDEFIQSDFAAVEAGKVADEDSFTTSDQIDYFEIGKGIFDTPITLETLSSDMAKPLYDEVAPTDEALVDYGRIVFDRVYYPAEGPNQYDTYALTYFLEDYAREGFPEIGFSKVLSDAVNTTDDFYGVANSDDDETMQFGKTLSDLSLSSDSSAASVGKALSDSVSKSDELTSDVGKAASDSVSKSDSAARDAGKSLADVFAGSDIIVRSTDKSLDDSAITSETKTFALAKSLLDSVHPTDDFLGVANADDDEVMTFNKTASDSFTKSDVASLTPGKGLTDSVSMGDSGSLVWTDYWDIGYTVTTSGVYVGNSQTF